MMRGTNSRLSEIVTPKFSINLEETEVMQQNLYLCIMVKFHYSNVRFITSTNLVIVSVLRVARLPTVRAPL